MTIEALAYLNKTFKNLNINYAYMHWCNTLTFPYALGEYIETQSVNEDGIQENTFILTVTTNTNYLDLEEIKERVCKYFPEYGRAEILDNGNALLISYSNSTPIYTGQEDLYRIQINLNIKEWKV